MRKPCVRLYRGPTCGIYGIVGGVGRMALLQFLRRLLGRREEAERRAAHDADTFRLLAEQSPDVIFRVRSNGVVTYISPSVEALYGVTAEEMMARGGDVTANDFVHPDDRERVAAAVARHFVGEVSELKTEFRILRHGEPVWVESNARTVANPKTGKRELIFTVRDISAKRAREEELAAAARTDGLTGLANRRAFDEALGREWSAALANGGRLSLLLLDVDRFKQFNDSYGHQVGDDCLRAISGAVSAACTPPAFAARYGGEELAIILPGCDTAEAVEIAEKVRAAIAGLRVPHAGNPAGDGLVSASIGVATALGVAGGSTTMPQALLTAADHALYKAKNEGRNRVGTAMVLAGDGKG